MRAPVSLLAVTTIALLGAALWPRPGHAVMLAFPPGVSAAPAFGSLGWRVLRLQVVGPFTLVLLAPETPDSDPMLLRRATGAAIVALAAGRPGCSALPRKE